MPRQPRLILPDVALHIIQRGNNRNACFLEDGDYLVYLANLRQLSEKFQCAVHAYCLMTNHVHLLITPKTADSCMDMMRDLGQRYVQYFNRRHGRSGTLWEGRFRSCPTESARYVLACYRYIELNPVRAGMVDHPSAYLWSSYAINSGMRGDAMISPHCELEVLGSSPHARHAGYRRMIDEGIDNTLLAKIRSATNGGYPLCSEHFIARVLAPLGCKLERGRPGPRRSGSDPESGSGSDPDLLSAGAAS